MGHADHAVLHAVTGGFGQNRLHGRDERLAPFQTKALLTDVAGVQITLQAFGGRQALENGAATRRRIGRARAALFELLLPPALLLGVRDVHKFGADRTAVGFPQGGEERAQRHLACAEIGVGDVKFGIEVSVRETVKRRLELADDRRLTALERVELGATGAEHAVGGDELLHEHLLFGHFHVFLIDGAHHARMALIGQAGEDFRVQHFAGGIPRITHDHLREIVTPLFGDRRRVLEPTFVERLDIGRIGAVEPT